MVSLPLPFQFPAKGIRPPRWSKECESFIVRFPATTWIRPVDQFLGCRCFRARGCDGRATEKTAGGVVRPEQRLDPRTQGAVAAADPVQESGTGFRVGEVEQSQEDVTLGHRGALSARSRDVLFKVAASLQLAEEQTRQVANLPPP